jgi:peptidoglycan/xylan/chitin deacetylase (PgdA/CDA1 family)
MSGQGIDNTHYAHSPLPDRPPLVWPGQARLALCVFIYFEYYELDPPPDSRRDPRFSELSGYFFPDYRTYSWHEYGNRVGIFRVLEALDRYGIKATVAANAEACRRYPYLVEAFAQRGYEFAAHGLTATRMVSSAMPETEERAHIAASLAGIERWTGRRPRGWVGQDYGESARTPQLLAAAGLDYVADWANDDQPYPMLTEPPLVSLPNQEELDDVQLLWHRRVPAPVYPKAVTEAFDVLWQEGAASGRFFGLHLHPWLIGTPHRIALLEKALAVLGSRPQVWQCRAHEVVDHLRAQPR